MFFQKCLYALLRRLMASRNIVDNTLGEIRNFTIELFPRDPVGKMTRADRASLSGQFASRAVHLPEIMTACLHPSSPHELYPEVLAM